MKVKKSKPVKDGSVLSLNYPKTIKVGLAFAIIMVFWSAYDFVIPLLLENAYGLSNSMRGLIMGLDNLLALFMLPLFGKISDKTKTKWGRRTPYIVLGTIVSVLLMIFVPVTANSSLKEGMALREKITVTSTEGYLYTDHTGTVYTSDDIYTMLYNEGKTNSDFSDHKYLENNDITTLEKYLEVANNRTEVNEDGKTVLTANYKKFVNTGINNYASTQVYEKVTKSNMGSLVIYMIILLFVLIAMATFRSPAVALMPDVTPKPLRSQANAMINLVGGLGAGIAFLIYTITFMFNPTGYIAIFIAVAASMTTLLGLFLWLVKEPKLVKECEAQCIEFGITDNEVEEEKLDTAGDVIVLSDEDIKKKKKALLTSFLLILASIFMWFMGYNAVSSNLSIFMTKTLNLSPGISGVVTGISMAISAIAFIPVGMLAVKIGRKKSIIIGFILAILAFLLIFVFASNAAPASMYLFIIFYLIAGFGLIIANVNTFPMVVELSTSGEVGKYTGFYYTATMSAQAITPFLAGVFMDKLGTKFLFIYSTVCVIIAIALMFFVKHGDSKAPPVKSKMEYLASDD